MYRCTTGTPCSYRIYASAAFRSKHDGQTQTTRTRRVSVVCVTDIPTHVCRHSSHFPTLRSTDAARPIDMAFKALSKSEKAYIQTSLQSQNPLRGDGRSLHEFRSVTLQTRVAPIANGSAHLNLGRSSDENIGGTEILAAAKLEVEDIAAPVALATVGTGNGNGNSSSGSEGGRIVCTVSWCVDPQSFFFEKNRN